MSGRFQDVWQYVWPEIWLELELSEIWAQLAEGSGYTVDEMYMGIYVELAKALRKAPQPRVYDATANDPVLARRTLETTPASALRCEAATIRFFENAYDAISEAGSPELEVEFCDLIRRFLKFRNLRYELIEPFKLHAHLPGVFAALFSDVLVATQTAPQLQQAMGDFEYAFRSLERSHSEADMKTCILKASMLVEALASAVPGAQGQTLGDLCNSIQCWPHSAIKEAVKRIYGFCSDYPGIRHNILNGTQIRALEMRDSIILPMFLLIAAGYFGANANLLDVLRSPSSELVQEPPDPPAIAESAALVSMP